MAMLPLAGLPPGQPAPCGDGRKAGNERCQPAVKALQWRFNDIQTEDPMHIDALKTLVVDALEDLKAKDIAQLDVSTLTSVTDLMVVASGTSTRHVAALAASVVEKAKQAGVQPLGVEGENGADWVLVDLGDVVVHVMLPETRQLYDLERLWADLPSDADRAARRDEGEVRGA